MLNKSSLGNLEEFFSVDFKRMFKEERIIFVLLFVKDIVNILT